MSVEAKTWVSACNGGTTGGGFVAVVVLLAVVEAEAEVEVEVDEVDVGFVEVEGVVLVVAGLV